MPIMSFRYKTRGNYPKEQIKRLILFFLFPNKWMIRMIICCKTHNAYNIKDYAKALNNYTEAQKLKPKEKYPITRLIKLILC